MTLMQTESIKIEEIKVEYVNGEPVKTVTSVKITRAGVQPLDYLTSGAISSLISKYADRTVQAVKVYSKEEITNKSIVTRLNTGKVYNVHKVYNYQEFGSTCDHYKAIIYFVED